MRFLHAIAMIVLIAGPAFAQSKPVPKYGETDAVKSAGELEGERAAESAYRRSLGNVPNASGPSDPWGGIRSDSSAKPAAKTVPAKRTKSTNSAN